MGKGLAVARVKAGKAGVEEQAGVLEFPAARLPKVGARGRGKVATLEQPDVLMRAVLTRHARQQFDLMMRTTHQMKSSLMKSDEIESDEIESDDAACTTYLLTGVT